MSLSIKWKKSSWIWVGLLGFGLFLGTSTTSCSPKSGCKATENMGPPVDKNGNLSGKRGKTKLFND
jgi:hypothetical protein